MPNLLKPARLGLALALLLGSPLPAALGTNLLQNSGFENALATDWTQEVTNWFTWGNAIRTNWQGNSGNYSIGIMGFWNAPYYGGFEQKAPVSENRNYDVGYYYFWDNGFVARQRAFSVHWYNAASNLIRSQQFEPNLVGVQSLWHFSGHYPLKSPQGAARVEIKFDFAFTNTGGVLYFDDVLLEDRGSAVEGELSNGGWEMPLDGGDAGNWLLSGNAIYTDWQKRSRTYAAGFCGQWSGYSNGFAVQRLAVTGQHVYAADLWHYRDADFTCAVRQIRVEWKNSGGAAISSNVLALPNPAATNWQHAGSYMVTSPAAATEAALRLFCDGTGTNGVYYMDDITWADASMARPSFFRRQGTNLVDRSGQPYLMRGLALSGWLAPEPYMLGILAGTNGEADTTTRMRNCIAETLRRRADVENFWNTYRSNFVTAADIQRLAAEGVNTFRLPINYRDVSPQNNEGAFLYETFDSIDRVLGWCRTNGIGVVLDLHVCPGGQAPENSGDSEYLYVLSNKEHAISCLWQTNAIYTNLTARNPVSNRKRTADIWRMIARRYRTNDQVIAYEVMNEPHLPSTSWSNVLRATLIQITDA
ncbi:MAG: cellulase family glycosylhydrolase, partial [Lentisphaerota bacterium]